MMNTRMHASSRIKRIDDLLESESFAPGGSALEIGCGAGYSSAHLASRYSLEVTGTDVEKAKVEAAARKNRGVPGASFAVADAASLPFGDESFDLILAQNVFHHVPDWRGAATKCALRRGSAGMSCAMRSA